MLHAGYGWFAPSGIAVTCDLYQHFFALHGSSHVDIEIRQEIDAMQDRLHDYEEQLAEELKDEGGGWHAYDFYKDDEEDKIYRLMMKKGWIRVGSWGIEEPCDMSVEGTAEALENQKCILAEMRRALRKTDNKLIINEVKLKKRRR